MGKSKNRLREIKESSHLKGYFSGVLATLGFIVLVALELTNQEEPKKQAPEGKKQEEDNTEPPHDASPQLSEFQFQILRRIVEYGFQRLEQLSEAFILSTFTREDLDKAISALLGYQLIKGSFGGINWFYNATPKGKSLVAEVECEENIAGLDLPVNPPARSETELTMVVKEIFYTLNQKALSVTDLLGHFTNGRICPTLTAAELQELLVSMQSENVASYSNALGLWRLTEEGYRFVNNVL